ncbi:MAG: response regulator transcription factor [Candidatus Latescibacteria bacterium]|nr:response regulator transcription factor [Candidatus Latescibacterota bacterium]
MTKHQIMKVLLVDKTDKTLEAIQSILEKIKGIEVIAVAKDYQAAIQFTTELKPEIIIMDINGSDFQFEKILKQLINVIPNVKIITTSLYSDSRYVLRALNAGASGYMLKDRAYEELAKAIRVIVSNKTYISPGIAGIVKEE